MTKRDNKQIRKRWTRDEQAKYLEFLTKFQSYFQNFKLRKPNKVFTQLANHIITRKSSQIKSHHQKLMRKYGSVGKIIDFLRTQLKGLEGQLSSASSNQQSQSSQNQVQSSKDLQASNDQQAKAKQKYFHTRPNLSLNSNLYQLCIESLSESKANKQVKQQILNVPNFSLSYFKIMEESFLYDFDYL